MKELFQEKTGKLSMTRVLFAFWGFGVLAVWVIISFVKGALQPISWEVMGIIFSLMTGKVFQKHVEK